MEEKDQYFEDLPQQRALREREVIKVHDKEEYLCRITLDVDFQLTPTEMMGIFSNPDNTGVFRDIYAVPFRKVVEDDGAGRQKIMVEQVSGFKFLVVPVTFSTHLNVEKNLPKFSFRYWLGKKGIMKKFVGEWNLFPITSPKAPDKVIGTRALLIQDLLPSFVPPFCGGFFKNVSKNAVQRLVEDINTLIKKKNEGIPFDELLKPVKDKHKLIEESQTDQGMSLSNEHSVG